VVDRLDGLITQVTWPTVPYTVLAQPLQGLAVVLKHKPEEEFEFVQGFDLPEFFGPEQCLMGVILRLGARTSGLLTCTRLTMNHKHLDQEP
jgi:hypothetical protein